MTVLRGTARAEIAAHLLDLSEGGAQLRLDAALTPGAIHDFAMEIDGEPVSVQAEVRRCAPGPEGGYVVGVEFVGIAPLDRALLRGWLARRDPGSAR